jgi:hypothetical protein
MACQAGFMVLFGLPPAVAGAMFAHRILHGNWHPSRACPPMMFGWWTILWILFGLTAGVLWSLGAAQFWPMEQVKEMSRGRTRIPLYTALHDRLLDWLFKVTSRS